MSTPIGPYRPIVRAGPWLITSGQLGLRPTAPGDGPDVPPTLVEGGAAAQLTQALANGAALLRDEGAAPADVAKTTVYVTDMAGYAAVNEAYAVFCARHRRVSAVVGVAPRPTGARSAGRHGGRPTCS